jgi:hypothetical protein
MCIAKKTRCSMADHSMLIPQRNVGPIRLADPIRKTISDPPNPHFGLDPGRPDPTHADMG